METFDNTSETEVRGTLCTSVFLNPFEFIRHTPGTNCGECGHPTCLAFAVAVTKGGASPSRCPYIDSAGLDAVSFPSAGNGLADVARGQEQRDLALAEHLKTKIQKSDFASLAPLLGGSWTADQPDLLRILYLGREVEISRAGLLINGVHAADPRDQILLYNYVASGGGTAPQGDWLGMESLPNSMSKVRTLATYCEKPLADHFAGRVHDLAGICAVIGAVSGPEEQSADLGVIVPVLPHVPQYLLFWDEDREENFESRVKVLFDCQVLDFLDIESLVFSAERMAERLIELDR
jgi:hypothetical protein